MKTQTIRLVDVFLIGPLMMSAGRRVAAQGGNVEGGLLMLLGFATIAYNGANYMTREQRRGTYRLRTDATDAEAARY